TRTSVPPHCGPSVRCAAGIARTRPAASCHRAAHLGRVEAMCRARGPPPSVFPQQMIDRPARRRELEVEFELELELEYCLSLGATVQPTVRYAVRPAV